MVIVVFEDARHVDVLVLNVVIVYAVTAVVLVHFLLLLLLLQLKLLVVSCGFDVNAVGPGHTENNG